MKIQVTHIKWDTDGDCEIKSKLPKSFTLLVDDEDEIADALSNIYGYCVESYKYTEL
jgi:hypothetical protein